MSHIFQRPLCDMGRAYDFAYRPAIGEPSSENGGPCDDRPRGVELCAASDDPSSPGAGWRSFSLCPEHEAQLRREDQRMTGGSRFRPAGPGVPPRAGTRR